MEIEDTDLLFSEKLACPDCGISFDEPAPNSFSFNSPYGWCPECMGLGARKELDDSLILPDMEMTINQGGVAPLGKPKNTWSFQVLRQLVESWGLDFETPLKKFNEEQMQWLRMIKDYVISSFHIEKEDFDLNPFNAQGGLGKMWQLFGDKTDEIINELNEALAA